MAREQVNEYVAPYKLFAGSVKDQMPLLMKDEDVRVPISVSGFMKRLLEVLNGDFSPEIKEGWDTCITTGDAVAYHPDGKAKFILDSVDLRKVNPQSKVVKGALVLPHGAYEALEGEEITIGHCRWSTHGGVTEDTKSNLLQFLARDAKVLSDYADLMSERYKNSEWYTGMRVRLAERQVFPTLMPINLPYYGGVINASDACCGNLEDPDARLIGVAIPGVKDEGVLRLPLESKVAAAINSRQAFDHNGTFYVPVADKEVTRK